MSGVGASVDATTHIGWGREKGRSLAKFKLTTFTTEEHEIEADFYMHQADFVNFYLRDDTQVFSVAAASVSTIELQK